MESTSLKRKRRFLFAPEARLGLRKNSLRVRSLVAEVIDSYARKNLASIMVRESQLVSLSGILPMAWEYEVGSARKHKKKWNHNYHGFVKVGNGWVANALTILLSRNARKY